jgi:hypothetical protein
MLVEVDGGVRGKRGDVRVAAKLSDDPDWPEGSGTYITLLHAD